MGKTSTAEMFRKLGYPVFDADASVHQLYKKGGKGAEEIALIFPDVIKDGAVNRQLLAEKIVVDNPVLPKIEKIIHPLVGSLEQAFIAEHKNLGAKLIVLDIPLLFEAGRTMDVDQIVVVSTSEKIQRQRALLRPGMTLEKLNAIIARQLPDSDKRVRADYVIDTTKSLEDAFNQIKLIVKDLDPTSTPISIVEKA